MSLTRKNRRELRRLRGHAQDVLDEQRIVLGHAGEVLQAAGSQARRLSDEHLTPRVNDAVATVRPQVDRGLLAARRASDQVRRATAPLVASALASTVRTLEQLENAEGAQQVRRFGEKRGLLAPQKKKRGVGGFIALGLGVAAAVGVGYTLWQAFRSDDELWVAPDSGE